MKLTEKIFNFSLIGGAMTILSFGTNIFMLKYFHTPLIATYIIVYFSTILISYFLNSYFTYKSSLSLRKSVIFFCIYLSTMLVGTFMYSFIPMLIKLPNWYYPFFVLPVTTMSNFLLNSHFMKKNL